MRVRLRDLVFSASFEAPSHCCPIGHDRMILDPDEVQRLGLRCAARCRPTKTKRPARPQEDHPRAEQAVDEHQSWMNTERMDELLITET